MQHKNEWELIQALLLSLLSLVTLNTSQTVLAKDPTVGFKSQAQDTVHSAGLWELESTVLI